MNAAPDYQAAIQNQGSGARFGRQQDGKEQMLNHR